MVVSNQGSYLREVRESQKVFSALVYAMEKGHKAVVAAIEDRQRDEEKRVETLVEELEQEIQELTKETTESEHQISVSDDQSEDTKQINLVSIFLCDTATLILATISVTFKSFFFLLRRKLFPSWT